MKVKYILIAIVFTSLFIGCKSKKHATRKSKKRAVNVEVIVEKPSKKPSKKTPKLSITNATLHYIAKYKDVAMNEMRVFKIPASITLAQGILESSSGRSKLTINSNNHFGIKCHKGWNGGKVYHDDDKKGECFRVYNDPKKSYRDHSKFLADRKRYAKLFKLKSTDYVGWAKGLSEAGYATDRRYPAKLIALIEKYDLHKYDLQVLGKKKSTKTVVVEEQKPKTHQVVKGDTLYSISRKYGITVEELKQYNNLSSNEIQIGQLLILTK
ncbi:glucosaminidase domain-containing protein [Lutibacter sp.]